jgi:hypothetical protein
MHGYLTLRRSQFECRFQAMLTDLAMYFGSLIDAESTHHMRYRHGAPGIGVAVVGIDHGNAVRQQAGKDAAFFASHFVHVTHAFEVSALGIGDQGHGRRADRGQVGDFTGMVHAHLDHRRTVRGIQAEQRERQADVVVQVAARRQHGIAELRLEDGCDHFLGCRLAIRAGNGDHRQREAGAPGGGEAAQPEAGVIDDDGGSAGRQFGGIGDHEGGGAAFPGLGKKIVGIETFTAERDEQLAGADGPGIGGNARQRDIGAHELAPDGMCDLREMPVHAAPSSWLVRRRASAACACSMSENG